MNTLLVEQGLHCVWTRMAILQSSLLECRNSAEAWPVNAVENLLTLGSGVGCWLTLRNKARLRVVLIYNFMKYLCQRSS